MVKLGKNFWLYNYHGSGQLCIISYYNMAYCTLQGIYAFVIEKDGVADSDEEVIQHLKQLIRKQIGGFAVPEAFLVRLYHHILKLELYRAHTPRAHCAIYRSAFVAAWLYQRLIDPESPRF